MVSRRKRARLRYLRKWYERYMQMTPEERYLRCDTLSFYPGCPVIWEPEHDELQPHLIEDHILEIQASICVQNRFCSECRHMLDDWPALVVQGRDPPHSVREFDTHAIEAAARSGCEFCACVLQFLLDTKVLEIYRKIEWRLHSLQAHNVSTLAIGTSELTEEAELKMTLPGLSLSYLSAQSGIRIDIGSCVSATEPVSDLTSPKKNVLDIAYAWVRACDDGHNHCKPRPLDSSPTRLISVSGKVVHLELTENWTRAPQYATLSYCWGAMDFIRTTTSTLGDFLTEIPEDRLPQTFKDAIQITRALKIGYIWIDSLCIVQDSDADWRKESSRMGEVYGSSYINLAASSATNPDEGCFTNPHFFHDILQTNVTISGQRYLAKFRTLRDHERYRLAVGGSHLLSRAWAIQEKLLANRTIHFGDRGAFWECRNSMGSECLPEFEGSPRFSSLATLTHNLAGAFQSELSSKWSYIIAAYSDANLTMGRDKLPGLAGIAQHFSDYKQCEYLAGMWKDTEFDTQLCWAIFTPQVRPSWRAPTWSWASVDSKVYFPPVTHADFKAMDIFCARTLQASVTRVSDAVYGEVSDGWIRVACSYILSGNFESYLDFRPHEAQCTPFRIYLDCTDDIDKRSGETIHVLPMLMKMGTLTKQATSSSEGRSVEGLVLQRTHGVHGEFRRIGSFTHFRPPFAEEGDDDLTAFDEFIDLLHRKGAATASEMCSEIIEDEEHGTGGFVITIV